VVRASLPPVGRAQHSVTQLFHFPDVLGATGFSHRVGAFSLLGSGPSFCQSFMVFVADSGFALVVADRIEFSMDCFPENPSALPQTPENAPGFTRCSSA
jgi:hypothetical protein